MDYLSCFSGSYEEARRKFRYSVTEAGGDLACYMNPEKGPAGLELTTDIAYFGSKNAEKLVIVISGTHGPEGLCGSGCQISWIRSGMHRMLPPGVAMLLIHYINPYGGAWLCRETEGNIDLNRNFLAHDSKHPKNVDYGRIHNALLLQGLDGQARLDSDVAYTAAKAKLGEATFLRALSNGQYDYQDGFYYGGLEPAWSNRTTHAILEEYARRAKEVAVIDYHTGYGPFGYGMLLCMERKGTPPLEKAREWYGQSIIAPFADGDDQLFSVNGSTYDGYRNALSHATVVPLCVEYGTYEPERDIQLHRKMNWLWRKGDPESPLGESIRREYLSQFYPDTMDWKEMIFVRSQQVIRQAITGLAGGGD